ncbi:MAG: hypothetical protein QXU40_04175 [Candidatus Pacearchaeota archaeon]
MNKRIVFIISGLILSVRLMGCDICGCSINGSYFGLLPQYRKHFIGLRTNYRVFQIKHPPLFSGESVVYSNDKAFTTEIWGRYQWGKKIQTFMSIPYQFNQRIENDIQIKDQGLGDITVNVLYTIWKTPDTVKAIAKQTLTIGLGIKVPTGKHLNTVVYNDLLLPGFQIGSASWDFPINFLYTIKRKSLGMNTEMTYQVNTKNRYSYKFGNRFSSAVRFFYWKYKPSLSILPQIGFSYENYNQDIKEKQWVRYTGGHTVWSFAGMDLYKGKWGLGAQAWYPLYQNVGEKHIKMLPRLTANLLFLF